MLQHIYDQKARILLGVGHALRWNSKCRGLKCEQDPAHVFFKRSTVRVHVFVERTVLHMRISMQTMTFDVPATMFPQ